MFKVIWKGQLYEVNDITEHTYVVYDIKKGHTLYLPKEECEVV